jgi:hypothetical protein
MQITGRPASIFGEPAFRRFEDRTYAHLKKYFPRHCRLLGGPRVRLVIRRGWQKAGHYRLTGERCARSYVEFMCLLGSGFDTDLLLPWASEILNDRATSSALARADRLYARVWDYIGHVAMDYRDATGRPTTARFVEELRTLRRESLQSLSNHAFPEFTHSLAHRLERIFPAKYGYVGPDRVYRLISHARARARRYGVTSERGVTVFTGEMFVLGGGFDVDPLLPWASRALNDARITDPAKRVDYLLSASVTALRQWWDSADRPED